MVSGVAAQMPSVYGLLPREATGPASGHGTRGTPRRLPRRPRARTRTTEAITSVVVAAALGVLRISSAMAAMWGATGEEASGDSHRNPCDHHRLPSCGLRAASGFATTRGSCRTPGCMLLGAAGGVEGCGAVPDRLLRAGPEPGPYCDRRDDHEREQESILHGGHAVLVTPESFQLRPHSLRGVGCCRTLLNLILLQISSSVKVSFVKPSRSAQDILNAHSEGPQFTTPAAQANPLVALIWGLLPTGPSTAVLWVR